MLRRGLGEEGLGLQANPFGFDQIFEKLGDRAAAFEGELIRVDTDFRVDGQVELGAELAVGIGFSWPGQLVVVSPLIWLLPRLWNPEIGA